MLHFFGACSKKYCYRNMSGVYSKPLVGCGAWCMAQNNGTEFHLLFTRALDAACVFRYLHTQYLALQSWSLQRQMQFWHLAHLCSSAFSQTGAKKVIVTPQHWEIINGSLTFTSVTKSQEKRARTSTGALRDRDTETVLVIQPEHFFNNRPRLAV